MQNAFFVTYGILGIALNLTKCRLVRIPQHQSFARVVQGTVTNRKDIPSESCDLSTHVDVLPTKTLRFPVLLGSWLSQQYHPVNTESETRERRNWNYLSIINPSDGPDCLSTYWAPVGVISLYPAIMAKRSEPTPQKYGY